MKNEKSAGVQAIFNILPFARAYGAKLTPDVLLRHGEKPRQIDFHWRSVAALFCETKLSGGNNARESVQMQVASYQPFNNVIRHSVQ